LTINPSRGDVARVPEVFRELGWVASFYSNEGTEPPHIHLRKGDGRAKFWLQPVRIVWARNLKAREIRQALELVQQHEDEILRIWAEYFDRQ
jgi:hypothetical protein